MVAGGRGGEHSLTGKRDKQSRVGKLSELCQRRGEVLDRLRLTRNVQRMRSLREVESKVMCKECTLKSVTREEQNAEAEGK